MVIYTESSDEDRKRAAALGAEEYLVKPFQAGELIEKLRAAAEGGRETRGRFSRAAPDLRLRRCHADESPDPPLSDLVRVLDLHLWWLPLPDGKAVDDRHGRFPDAWNEEPPALWQPWRRVADLDGGPIDDRRYAFTIRPRARATPNCTIDVCARGERMRRTVARPRSSTRRAAKHRLPLRIHRGRGDLGRERTRGSADRPHADRRGASDYTP